MAPRLGVVSQPVGWVPSAFHRYLPGDAGPSAGSPAPPGPATSPPGTTGPPPADAHTPEHAPIQSDSRHYYTKLELVYESFSTVISANVQTPIRRNSASRAPARCATVNVDVRVLRSPG